MVNLRQTRMPFLIGMTALALLFGLAVDTVSAQEQFGIVVGSVTAEDTATRHELIHA